MRKRGKGSKRLEPCSSESSQHCRLGRERTWLLRARGTALLLTPPGQGGTLRSSAPAHPLLQEAPSDRSGTCPKETQDSSGRKVFAGPSGRFQSCSGNTLRENGFKEQPHCPKWLRVISKYGFLVKFKSKNEKRISVFILLLKSNY